MLFLVHSDRVSPTRGTRLKSLGGRGNVIGVIEASSKKVAAKELGFKLWPGWKKIFPKGITHRQRDLKECFFRPSEAEEYENRSGPTTLYYITFTPTRILTEPLTTEDVPAS